MKKTKTTKKRTSITPHRVMELSSIWLMPQTKVDRKNYYGYEGGVNIQRNDGKEVKIVVRSSVELKAEHGRMFHFANSCAMKSDKYEASVHVNDLLDELGLSRQAKNRERVSEIMKGCISATVIIKTRTGESMFHLLESAKYDSATGIISFRVNKDYYDAVKLQKERYINVSEVMRLRASNEVAIELATYLQIRGGGVDSNGNPKAAKTVSHDDLLVYLHLVTIQGENKHKAREVVLRRAFKSLEDKGYPHYKLMTIDGVKVWTCNPATKVAKTFIQIDDFSE